MSEEYTAETRPWRTLFHIINVHEHDGVFARVPGWNSRIAILIPWEQIAPEIHDKIVLDGRYYGNLCLGAESWEDLNPYINEAPIQLTDEELKEELGF